RSQDGVLGGMPFLCKVGVRGCQTVRFVHPLIRAEWTAALLASPAVTRSLPLVTLRTKPPNFLSVPESHIAGIEYAVFGVVPLPGEIWMSRGEAVGGNHLDITATGTAIPRGSTCDRRYPLVVSCLRAFPPDLFVAPRFDILRSAQSVFNGMPLKSQIGM